MFYTFEGIDGSGKSTVLHEVYYKLRHKYNADSVSLRDTEMGRALYKFLENNKDFPQEAVASSFLSSLWAMYYEKVAPVKHNTIVLCDRYIHSTYAYQFFGGENTLKTNFAFYQLNTVAADTLPNKTFYFDTSLETAQQRISHRKLDRFESELSENLVIAYKNCYEYQMYNPIILLDESMSINMKVDFIYNTIVKDIGNETKYLRG